MASSNPLIPPFWTRVPRFFLFPLNPAILWRVLFFAAIPAIGAFASSPQAIALAAAGLSLLAWVFLLRFGSRVLSETSLGRLSPSQYPDLPDDSLSHMPYKIMALFIIPGMAVGLVASLFGEGMGMLANFALMLILPAALMALVISRSLFTGLNPAAGWGMMRDIGSPYLLLCVFLYFLSTAQMFLIAKVFEHSVMPLMLQWGELKAAVQHAMQAQDEVAFDAAMEGMHGFFQHVRPRLAGSIWLITAVGMHFTLIAFNMLGYVLYQFHEQLGLEVDVLPGRRGGPAKNANPAKAAEDAASQRIAEFLAEGQVDQALEVAYEAQRLDPDNTTVQERYNKLLHLAGKDDRLLNHSQKLIPLLLRKEQKRGALEAWKRCREKQPEFRPEDAATVVQLAEAARASREPKTAMEILNGFDKVFRNHPLLAEVYCLGGQILCEDLQQDALAERFFVTLANRFPDHPRVEDAGRLRQIIARMQQNAAPVRPPA
jgi:tetratricopeptide (TPR) repeat protein